MRFLIFRRYSTRKSTYYITTPIYYVNADPHIGHLYSSVVADAIQRWQRIRNPTVSIRFATGTDEHGTKIQRAASKTNSNVRNYCDNTSTKYKILSKCFDIDFTDFVRTSDEIHLRAVQIFWRTIYNNGHIYSSKYSGWYCVSDETFLTNSQLKEVVMANGDKSLVSIESGHSVEWTEEQNYMFRLSHFQNDLIYWLKTNENVVKPKKFCKILLDMVSNEDLRDLSISRPSNRVFWGINVPGDDTQTVYVWLDALVNYLTVAGYTEGTSGRFQEAWPPDVQVIGKDILKFHGIYWPAFLLAANLELPKCLLCHSHWTVDGEKMSKSKNNVVSPLERKEVYSTDGLRYFLLREGVAHSDGNYSDTKVIRILNSELADTLGNLLSRCCSNSLNPEQVFPKIESEAFQVVKSFEVTKKLMEAVYRLPDVCEQHYLDFNFYKVVDAAIATLHSANLFFESLKPWELRKNANTLSQLHVVLHLTIETLRICATILLPIIPNLSKQILNKLCIPEKKWVWEEIKYLSWDNKYFKTISLSQDKPIIFRRLMINQESNKKAKL